MYKSKAVSFFLSFVPGVGHLYLGLQQRGLALMGSAFLCIVLMPMFPLIFPFVLAMIWFFGLFDALQQTTAMNRRFNHARGDSTDDEEMIVDDLLLSPRTASRPSIPSLWTGIIFIAVGIVLLFHILFPHLWSWLSSRHIGAVILALVIIGFGVYYLRRHWRGE
ncbi:hypothetical protein [Alicyclobacillus dauci]|uniref:TM2 domain-containing protein n=1 Tax=Alicyclobacillus dauci TaxID=1475485 RepID=A0ABY6YZ37_9BACL|nr:hypothetical protein [Alicyclobacillus dauci]WAH35903.1 hypothetical protein NZD86_16755 [Alicyclobacillus dauci]